MNRLAPISGFASPCATSRATSHSRSVIPSGAGEREASADGDPADEDVGPAPAADATPAPPRELVAVRWKSPFAVPLMCGPAARPLPDAPRPSLLPETPTEPPSAARRTRRRSTSGEKRGRCAAAASTASTTSSGGESLSRKPSAPDRSASSRNSSVSKAVSITTRA